MSFDWKKSRELAEELRQRDDEAEDEGFVYRQDERSHQQVWQEFKNRGRTHRAIGFSGIKWRNNRVEANYIDEIEGVEKLTQASFKIGEKFLFIFSKLKRKSGINENDISGSGKN